MATRVVFVGAGSISANHFDSMDELGDAVDVVGVADPSEEARAFIKAVQVGDASNVLSPFADAVKTLELTLAAVESAKTNAVVELQESLI